MADKKMNQATPASDGTYVYAEASDGSLVKISKQSLASLIRTEMQNSGLFPFMGFNDITNYDFNKCTKGGYYYINSYSTEITNKPPMGNYGGLIVFPCRSYILQIAFDIYKDSLFIRNSHDGGGVWKDWRTI